MSKFGHGKSKQPIDLDGRGLEPKPQEKNKQGVTTLAELNKLVNWQALVGLVKGLDKTQSGKGGRPPISFEVKLKMLFLQYTFNLSDEQLEDQFIDSLHKHI